MSSEFTSEDADLNRLLESARQKFARPDFHTRYDALKELWDAFERLKTLEPPRADKWLSSEALIARVSNDAKVREMLGKVHVVRPDPVETEHPTPVAPEQFW